jgi:cation transport ATPase
MLTGLLHVHSLLRYVLLILLLISIVKAFSGWLGKKPFTDGTRKLGLFTLISAHLQLVIGLALYFMNGWQNVLGDMENRVNRFFSMEHSLMMILAIALITIGYSSSKKGKTDEAKYKRIAIFFLAALIIIFLMIPWPWKELGRGWMPGMQ